MAFGGSAQLAAGTRVQVSQSMDVPDTSVWDDDRGRSSTLVKKRLQSMFFKQDRKISGEVIYISRESEREKLRRKGLVKVRLRDASGSAVIITAEAAILARAR
jgi:hypothetical protein